MFDIDPPKVLVGVAEDVQADGVLDFAVNEARRRGCGIHVVHVMQPSHVPSYVDSVELVDGELRKSWRQCADGNGAAFGACTR